jgi:hypothetical protein
MGDGINGKSHPTCNFICFFRGHATLYTGDEKKNDEAHLSRNSGILGLEKY